jgi:hypothetical protein
MLILRCVEAGWPAGDFSEHAELTDASSVYAPFSTPIAAAAAAVEFGVGKERN